MERNVLKRYEDVETYFNNFDFSIISFDTETTSLDYYTMDIHGFSLCNGRQAVYIDLIDNEDKGKILKVLEKQLQTTKLLIGHNLVFDLKALRSQSIGLTDAELYDTGDKYIEQISWYQDPIEEDFQYCPQCWAKIQTED